MTNTYRCAGRNIEIRAMHPAVYAICGDYETDGAVDFEVSTTQTDTALAATCSQGGKSALLPV